MADPVRRSLQAEHSLGLGTRARPTAGKIIGRKVDVIPGWAAPVGLSRPLSQVPAIDLPPGTDLHVGRASLPVGLACEVTFVQDWIAHWRQDWSLGNRVLRRGTRMA